MQAEGQKAYTEHNHNGLGQCFYKLIHRAGHHLRLILNLRQTDTCRQFILNLCESGLQPLTQGNDVTAPAH